MKTVSSAELKNNFAYYLEKVSKGEEFVVEYGRKKKKVARIVPFQEKKKAKRKLGQLEGKVKISFSPDFKMTTEEFLGL